MFLFDRVADYLDCHLVLRVLNEALTSLLGGLPGALQSGNKVTNNAKIMSKSKSQRKATTRSQRKATTRGIATCRVTAQMPRAHPGIGQELPGLRNPPEV